MSTSDQTSEQTPPTSTVRVCSESVCSEADIAEQQLDQHIKDCGNRMVAAAAAGDREDCNQWRERMYAAIRSRTPEHQARMTARIESAIWFQGAEAQAMGKEAA